jgi:hypothetical protein
MEPVTIYRSGAFGVERIEAKLVAHGRKKYAQYDNAPFVKYVPKGKRTPKGIIGTFKPFILILSGHGHPSPASGMTAPEVSDTGFTVTQSRYSSFDPRYEVEFNEMIDGYLASKPDCLIADYRHTSGVQS